MRHQTESYLNVFDNGAVVGLGGETDPDPKRVTRFTNASIERKVGDGAMEKKRRRKTSPSPAEGSSGSPSVRTDTTCSTGTGVSPSSQGAPPETVPQAVRSSSIKLYATLSEVPRRTFTRYLRMCREMAAHCQRETLSGSGAVPAEEEGLRLERDVPSEDLPRYLSDPRCGFVAWHEGRTFVGGAALLISRDHVSLYGSAASHGHRDLGFVRRLLIHVMATFPEAPVYVVLHREEDLLVLQFLCIAFRATTGGAFYADEHPFFRREDGYVGVLLALR